MRSGNLARAAEYPEGPPEAASAARARCGKVVTAAAPRASLLIESLAQRLSVVRGRTESLRPWAALEHR